LTFRLAKKLEYGLKLVRDRSDDDHFVISAEAITDMDKYVNDLVKAVYRQGVSPSELQDTRPNPLEATNHRTEE
jgi:hypothetical protein